VGRRKNSSKRQTRETRFAARLVGGIRYYRTAQQGALAKKASWASARRRNTHRAAEASAREREAERERVKAIRASLSPEKIRAWDRIARHLERAPGHFRWNDIRELYYGQKCRCLYCGVHLGGPPPSDARFHIDHKKAVALGGTNRPENLCLACPPCNMEKSASPLGAYIEGRKRRGLPVPSDGALHPNLHRALRLPDKRSKRSRKARAVRASDDPWDTPQVIIRRRPERGKADRQEVPSEVRIEAPLRPLPPPSRKAQAPGGSEYQGPAVAG